MKRKNKTQETAPEPTQTKTEFLKELDESEMKKTSGGMMGNCMNGCGGRCGGTGPTPTTWW